MSEPHDITRLDGRILTPKGWAAGRIEFDTHVRRIVAGEPAGDAPWIIPGFVDLHVPGGGGADVMQGEDAVRTAARLHARHGTTSFLPATITAPLDDIARTLDDIGRVRDHPKPGEARVLGAHMEGPFINPGRLGAQPPFATLPDEAFIEALETGGIVRVVTMAPEIDGGLALIGRLARSGIAVQIGHTDADYETACAALSAGARGFTHLYNAMSALHHRAPGVTGAALAKGEYAALIPDGVHVAPGAMLAALRAIPRLFCVTDACAAAGMPDGEYPLGTHRVIKRGDSVYLAQDETVLAGSALTMDRALARLIDLGLDLAEASRRLSAWPAAFIGADRRGRIEPGAHADLVVLGPGHDLRRVFVEGAEIALD